MTEGRFSLGRCAVAGFRGYEKVTRPQPQNLDPKPETLFLKP